MKAPFLYQLDLWSGLLPVGVLIPRLRGTERWVLYLFLFFLSSCVSDVVSFLLARQGRNNLWLLDIYDLLEFVLLTLFFREIDREGRWRTAYGVLLAGFVLFWVAGTLVGGPFLARPGFSHTLSSGILCVFSVHVLVRSMKDESFSGVISMQFVSVSLILLYFAGNLFLFGSLNAMTGLRASEAVEIWQYHWWLSILFNILFSGGIVWTSRS